MIAQFARRVQPARRAAPALAALGLVAALAGCGVPMSPEVAARACTDRARLALGPKTTLKVGATTNNGPYAGAKITASSDWGRDPQRVYDQCFRQKTGHGPTVPLDLP